MSETTHTGSPIVSAGRPQLLLERACGLAVWLMARVLFGP
jgi:hypothetical protein